MTDLFGKEQVQEETIVFTYKGDKFRLHEMELESFVVELKGVEVLVKETIEFYKKKHNLQSSEVDFEIFVRVEGGSVKEIIRIVKKNATTITLLGTFVMPFIQSGFDYYLNKRENGNPEVIQILEENKKIRKSFKDILVPITGSNNVVSIQAGDIIYEVNSTNKADIVEEINKHEEFLDNQEVIKEEHLVGTISVSKLYDVSPFNFRISETTQDIPLYFNDLKFDLEERQEFLGKELILKAKVTYKNNRKTSIEVVEYKEVEKLFEIKS